MAMKSFADRRKSEEAALADPHALDFAKKRRLFEKPPSVLEEGMIRDQLTDIYGKFKEVKKALNKQTQTPDRIQKVDTLFGSPMWNRSLVSRSATILCDICKIHSLSKNKQNP